MAHWFIDQKLYCILALKYIGLHCQRQGSKKCLFWASSVPLSSSRILPGTFGDGGFILARIKITKLVTFYPVTGFCLLEVRHPPGHLSLQKQARENALEISEVMVIGHINI